MDLDDRTPDPPAAGDPTLVDDGRGAQGRAFLEVLLAQRLLHGDLFGPVQVDVVGQQNRGEVALEDADVVEVSRRRPRGRKNATVPKRRPGARKAEILEVASDLFHRSGFHRVGMDDIGEAAGVTGPAIYSHFSSKTSLLAAIIERVADELVDVDRLIAEADGPADALRRLVTHHVDFALKERALIAVYLREFLSLPQADRRRLRESQHYYIDRWVENLLQIHPDMDPAEALSLAHGVFNFIASIALYEPKLDRRQLRDLLERKAIALLLDEKSQ